MRRVIAALALLSAVTVTQAREELIPFSMDSYSLMLPADVIVSNRYGEDFTIYDFRTRERYLFSAFVGNFPNTSIMTVPAGAETFSFDNYPQQQAPYWNCGDKKQWKCLRKELYFPANDGASSVQFFYDEVSPVAAGMANTIIKTLKSPVAIDMGR